MSPIVQLYALYSDTLKRCYLYKEKSKYNKLLYEIGKLKGLADALEIYNIEIKNLEFKNFMMLQKKLINNIKNVKLI